MKADVLFLILAGIVAIIALMLMPQGSWAMQVMGTPAQETDLDLWQTPYYLRYNVSLHNHGLKNMLPIPANYTYALGVPSAPFTQTAVTQQGG
jgi:hypothetical protein